MLATQCAKARFQSASLASALQSTAHPLGSFASLSNPTAVAPGLEIPVNGNTLLSKRRARIDRTRQACKAGIPVGTYKSAYQGQLKEKLRLAKHSLQRQEQAAADAAADAAVDIAAIRASARTALLKANHAGRFLAVMSQQFLQQADEVCQKRAKVQQKDAAYEQVLQQWMTGMQSFNSIKKDREDLQHSVKQLQKHFDGVHRVYGIMVSTDMVCDQNASHFGPPLVKLWHHAMSQIVIQTLILSTRLHLVYLASALLRTACIDCISGIPAV